MLRSYIESDLNIEEVKQLILSEGKLSSHWNKLQKGVSSKHINRANPITSILSKKDSKYFGLQKLVNLNLVEFKRGKVLQVKNSFLLFTSKCEIEISSKNGISKIVNTNILLLHIDVNVTINLKLATPSMASFVQIEGI